MTGMRRFFAVLLAIAVIAAPMGFSIAAAAKPILAAESAPCDDKTCPCGPVGDCPGAVACDQTCYSQPASVASSKKAAAPRRAVAYAAAVYKRSAFAKPPPLHPPQI